MRIPSAISLDGREAPAQQPVVTGTAQNAVLKVLDQRSGRVCRQGEP
jgi:hypothetical protein